jgi:hypothetical protein
MTRRPITSKGWSHRVAPGVTLLLLAPVLGELVSGHQTLVEFVNPVSFLVTALPYGFGALICRELTVRWRKGWLCLVLLALAFGIYEEAIVARSLWDPTWSELGALGAYSYRGGVTWTYAAVLLHFHVTISIIASVLLAHLIHPDKRRDPWLTTGQLVWCGVGLALWSPALMILNPFTPPVWGILACVLAIVVLVVSGRRLPARVPGGPKASLPPIRYGLVAGVNTTAVFVAVFLLPEADPRWLPAWPATVAFVVVADAIAAWAILRWSASGTGWDDRHKLALVIGMLAFFLVMDVAADVQGPFGGLSLVAVLTVVALVQLWSVTTRRVGSPTA